MLQDVKVWKKRTSTATKSIYWRTSRQKFPLSHMPLYILLGTYEIAVHLSGSRWTAGRGAEVGVVTGGHNTRWRWGRGTVRCGPVAVLLSLVTPSDETPSFNHHRETVQKNSFSCSRSPSWFYATSERKASVQFISECHNVRYRFNTNYSLCRAAEWQYCNRSLCQYP
jgi:hypothetical protein